MAGKDLEVVVDTTYAQNIVETSNAQVSTSYTFARAVLTELADTINITFGTRTLNAYNLNTELLG